MKKLRSIVICLLACLLLSVNSAGAETGYLALRQLLSSKSQQDLYLGNGVSSSTEKDNTIWVVFNEKEEIVYLVGVNEYDKGEITLWSNVAMGQGYYIIYSLCNIWDTLNDNIEKGYSVVLALTEIENVEGDWIIDDAESAAAFVTVMETAFASLEE